MNAGNRPPFDARERQSCPLARNPDFQLKENVSVYAL